MSKSDLGKNNQKEPNSERGTKKSSSLEIPPSLVKLQNTNDEYNVPTPKDAMIRVNRRKKYSPIIDKIRNQGREALALHGRIGKVSEQTRHEELELTAFTLRTRMGNLTNEIFKAKELGDESRVKLLQEEKEEIRTQLIGLQ